MSDTHITAIIVAAGKGTRAGGGVAKQWCEVAGKRVVDWTLDAFRTHPKIASIVLVVPRDFGPNVAEDIIVTHGGADRGASVKAGLDVAPIQTTHVMIHDAARPCVTPRIIDDVATALRDTSAAAPALAVTDALWRGSNNLVTDIASRDGLYRAQTPQGFEISAIRQAHDTNAVHADDVAAARAAGIPVAIVTGDARNIKITTPEDFALAASYLSTATFDIRTGNGFDVHRFGPGDHVMLCGVRVPHNRGLQGHSDADVGLHTITDAIYGALAQGDIGQHFPPSDPQWKGAESHVFLRHAVSLAQKMGFTITHIDCTLICEDPKIGPHAQAMREKLAEITDIDVTRISVKATTSEQLGFTGRREGIAAQATATLVKS